MRNNQGGVKFGFVLLSVLVLGVSAWFTQAQASELPASTSHVKLNHQKSHN
ncbi:hypothetical protein [Pseudoalteromonas xiamenensis]|uniref:Uncharacterized protein n=1 Tax=Pseudoalteromonas xiamenensis TaxID=882626 RepID=A0A975DG91_9GAMM|nr:hypothetical protein [Pseudoalteromonas xiamenensis]QTH71162.1 hypothetical protein J5O05_15325 [Pseudoalteromonas xiamenensis]